MLFFTCLIISAVIWLFYTLSESYSYVSPTAVHYINPPYNKAFHPLQPDTVNLTVQGTGWQMLFDKMRFKPASIDADIKSLATRNYIVFSDQLSRLNQKTDADHRIIAVDPDTLYFDFSTRSRKRVAVRLIEQLTFKKRFGISSEIILRPAFITITGSAAELKNIQSWPTDSLNLQNIDHSVVAKVNLSQRHGSAVDIFPPAVTASIPVDEFTEKEITIPLKILNAGNRKVRLLPSKVKVTFLSSLGKFHVDDWEKTGASVNLADWTDSRYTQLPVTLVNVPAFSRVLKIDPQTIDFMVAN
jgi:YbbR domain-containing protein